VPVVFLMNQAFDAAPRGGDLSGLGRFVFAAASRRVAAAIVMDLFIASAAFFGALLLRFDFNVPVATVVKMLATLPGVLIATIAAFAAIGIYRSTPGATAAGQAVRFAVAAVVAAGLAGVFSLPNEFVIPRGSCVVFAVLLFNLLLVTRWSFEVLMRMARNFIAGAQRVVIVGADARGEAAVNHLFTKAAGGIELLGIVDDDHFKHGKLFHGYPVLGSIRELGAIFDRTNFNEILIAQERLEGAQLSALQSFAVSHQVSLRKFSLSLTELGQSAGEAGEMVRAS
jgi:FlaA1/EpsC-like NDP-sugar epimerase